MIHGTYNTYPDFGFKSMKKNNPKPKLKQLVLSNTNAEIDQRENSDAKPNSN